MGLKKAKEPYLTLYFVLSLYKDTWKIIFFSAISRKFCFHLHILSSVIMTKPTMVNKNSNKMLPFPQNEEMKKLLLPLTLFVFP